MLLHSFTKNSTICSFIRLIICSFIILITPFCYNHILVYCEAYHHEMFPSIEGDVTQWCNLLALQQDQSNEQDSIPGRAQQLEHLDKGSRTPLALGCYWEPSTWPKKLWLYLHLQNVIAGKSFLLLKIELDKSSFISVLEQLRLTFLASFIQYIGRYFFMDIDLSSLSRKMCASFDWEQSKFWLADTC